MRMPVQSENITVSELLLQLQINRERAISHLGNVKDKKSRCLSFINDDFKSMRKLLCQGDIEVKTMSLIILATVCSQRWDERGIESFKNARKIYIRNEIINHILKPMRDLSLPTSLHCQACRLIGNLAIWYSKSLTDLGILETLNLLLRSKQSILTYIMAIRAVRNICYARKMADKEDLILDIVGVVTQLFTMAVEKSVMDKEYHKLVNVCLRAMCGFVIQYGIIKDYPIVKQMNGDDNNKGYKYILRCYSEGNIFATYLVILFLSANGRTYLLETIGPPEEIIPIIRDQSDSDDHSLFIEKLAGLTFQSRIAYMREIVVEYGGLELIIELLRKPRLERHVPMLLNCIVRYFDITITKLHVHGVVNFFMARLPDILARPGGRRRVNYVVQCPCFRCDFWPNEIETIRPTMEFNDFKTRIDDMQENGEWIDELPVEITDSTKWFSCQKTSTNGLYRQALFSLFKKLIRISEFYYPLASPGIIIPILKYIKKTNNERATYIARNILWNTLYFVPLVEQNLVQQMFELQEYIPSHFIQELYDIAKTPFAIKDLSSMLQGDMGEENQRKAAVTIPFLIDESTFKKTDSLIFKTLLYTDANERQCALRLIIGLLDGSPSRVKYEAICALLQLVRKLHVQYETVNPASMTSSNTSDDPRKDHEISQPSKVTSGLDDGTTVYACKRILCECPDVFKIMGDHFFEAGIKRIRLKQVDQKTGEPLLLTSSSVPSIFQDIELLLDTIRLHDMYLTKDTKKLLDNLAIKLNHHNFLTVWHFASAYQHNWLKDTGFKILLTTIKPNEMLELIEDLSTKKILKQFLHAVSNIIVAALRDP